MSIDRARRRHVPRAAALAAAVCVLLTACAPTSAKPAPELVLVKTTPSPTPTPTPDPTPASTTTPPAEPFGLTISDVLLASTSNAAMFAGPEPRADEPVVQGAIEAARLKGEAYLNAMFVNPDTRFTTEAVRTLVDPATLDAGSLAALGVLDAPGDVVGTRTGTATAIADVHVDVTTIGAVTLAFTATAELVLAGAEGPITQEGYLSVVDRGAGPEVVLLTATTTFGGTLPEVLG